ncbi:MAG TPA: DegT/DnrJ/EryC1/StrS family aminotransferase [Anaerolineales bacterium]|nr:DegT/DnrJ/EryC1/StrS family aminotransferase [Anaerolineales bacterium]
MVDLTAQYHSIQSEIDNAIHTTLELGHFILGPSVSLFEQRVAEYLGVKYAIGLASGTDALILALRALDIGPNDEVLVPAYTFFATAGAVLSVGAKPVFVDVDPQTYQIDVDQIKTRISSKTKAIIPVHLYGYPAEIGSILKLAQDYRLKVIEDNAQAFGAEFNGKMTGSFGDIGCLSFFPTKNLGAYGDGGMVVTNDPSLDERIRMLRTHGWKKKYFSEELGYNSRLDAMQASILQVKLKYVNSWNQRRRELANAYNERLKPLGLGVPVEHEGRRHVYHLYIIRTEHRDKLRSFLEIEGVSSEIYYPLPPHLAKPCLKLGYREGDFPNAERASQETLALPMYPELTDKQQNVVISAVEKYVKSRLRESGASVESRSKLGK